MAEVEADIAEIGFGFESADNFAGGKVEPGVGVAGVAVDNSAAAERIALVAEVVVDLVGDKVRPGVGAAVDNSAAAERIGPVADSAAEAEIAAADWFENPLAA